MMILNSAFAFIKKHYDNMFSIEVSTFDGLNVMYNAIQSALSGPYSWNQHNCADAVLDGLQNSRMLDGGHFRPPLTISYPNDVFQELRSYFSDIGHITQPY